MKYLLFLIGIVLSIAGFLMFFGAVIALSFTTVDIPTSLIIIEMIFYGFVPFAGGIALCYLTSKHWSSSIQCRNCNNKVELSSIMCPNCSGKVGPAMTTAASDNRFKRLCRKIFLEESPRQSEGNTANDIDEPSRPSEGNGKVI